MVFGSSGDLATKRLLPAVKRFNEAKMKGGTLGVVGVDSRGPGEEPSGVDFHFVDGDLLRGPTYEALASTLGSMAPSRSGGVIFYLATGPALFRRVVKGLRDTGLHGRGGAPMKVAIEKPYGLGLKGAIDLQREVDLAFDEEQVFRVDHFLQKGVVRDLMSIRAERGLERLWSREFVERVWFVADESLGVEGRGDFYDGVGVVGDMVQNHLLQLLCMLGAENRGRGELEEAKLEEVRGVRTLSERDAVLGQYKGYREAAGVVHDSNTPTFVSARLFVDTRRWRGVPFVLRTGKKLHRDATEIVICFRGAHTSLARGRRVRWNQIRIRLDPPEGVDLGYWRGPSNEGSGPRFGAALDLRPELTEYDRIVRDLVAGDRTNFVGRGFNESAWRIFDPLLSEVELRPRLVLPYGQGTSGPGASSRIMEGSPFRG